jgi:DNA topoisomerase-3
MPLFEKGESGPHEPSLKQGQTRPPRAFDENTLLAAMETAGKQIEDEELREAMKEKGLGTPATRAQIIETLLHRGYIERDKKRLSATDLGRFLIYLIQDEALKSPEMTGEWEAKLKAIEQGKLDAAEFMRGIVEYTRGIVRGGAPQNVDGLGPCPKCRAPVIQGRRGYGCSRWKEGCDFVLWMEYKGAQIRPAQARQLLTRRILLDPLDLEGRGPTILCLGPRGALLELQVPSRDAQKREKRERSTRPQGRGRSSSPGAPGASPASL